jgi:hypothetical protein
MDAISGVASVTFTVQDEYGRIQPSGEIELTNDSFTITVLLEARRLGTDKNGRQYVFLVTATDKAGNTATGTATAIVPHDQR